MKQIKIMNIATWNVRGSKNKEDIVEKMEEEKIFRNKRKQ